MTATEEKTTRKHLTSGEVATELSVDIDTVYGWLTNGVEVAGVRIKLRGFKAGYVWRIPPEAPGEFVRACTPGGEALELDSERARREAADEEAGRRLDERLDRPRRRKGRAES